MSSFRLAPAIALLLLLLPACGFQPLHGGGTAAQERADIGIAPIPDREGQYLRNLLIDRLHAAGRPADPRRILKIESLRIETADLGIQRDATVTRTQIEITARLRLVDASTQETLLDRRLRAVGGYDVLDAQYATLVTKSSATDHILEELAESAVTELNLYLSRAEAP